MRVLRVWLPLYALCVYDVSCAMCFMSYVCGVRCVWSSMGVLNVVYVMYGLRVMYAWYVVHS